MPSRSVRMTPETAPSCTHRVRSSPVRCPPTSEKKPPMSEPHRDTPERPMPSPFFTTDASPSKSHAVVGSPPQTTCAQRRRTRPARALEADERTALAPREVVRRTVIVGRIAVVRGGGVAPVLRAGIERRVLAEVLHPAVVTVVDGQREQRRVCTPSCGRAEVELADVEEPRREVLIHVRKPVRGHRERAGASRVVERRLVGAADHRIEVRRDGVAERVRSARARRLVRAVASARQVVQVRLRHRDRDVAVAELLQRRRPGTRDRTPTAPRAPAADRRPR